MNRFCNPVMAWHQGQPPKFPSEIARELDYVIPNVTQALHRLSLDAPVMLVVHAVCARWTLDKRDAPLHMRERDYDLFDTPAIVGDRSVGAPARGTAGTQNDRVLIFTGTGLEYLLHNAGIENLVLCGQYGSACVFYSLIQSRELNFKKRLWLDATASYMAMRLQSTCSPTLVGQHCFAYWQTGKRSPTSSRAVCRRSRLSKAETEKAPAST